MRRFSFFQRGEVFYAQLLNPITGRYMSGRSTGARSKDEALLVVADWLKNGIPSVKGEKIRPTMEVYSLDALLAFIRSPAFSDEEAGRVLSTLQERGFLDGGALRGTPGAEMLESFLVRFWTYEKSPYVSELAAHGRTITKRHCLNCLQRARKYWLPFFKGKRLAEISKTNFQEFSLFLAGKGLSPTTINHILTVGRAAFGWAAAHELIKETPADGQMRFSEKHMKRGVLCVNEAKALFAQEWDSERARIGCEIAMVCGLRIGEVQALQIQDFSKRWLFIRHSWNPIDGGLKGTKTGEERKVPLVASVYKELKALIKKNPHGGQPEDFIFYSTDSARPMSYYELSAGLERALVRLSLGDRYTTSTSEEKAQALKKWKERRITFHSFRHLYASRMVDKMKPEAVMRSTGHKDRAVFDVYADHLEKANLDEVGKVAEEVFGKMLSFPKAASEKITNRKECLYKPVQ